MSSIWTHPIDYPYMNTRISKIYRKIDKYLWHLLLWQAHLDMFLPQLNGSTKRKMPCHVMSQLGFFSNEIKSPC